MGNKQLLTLLNKMMGVLDNLNYHLECADDKNMNRDTLQECNTILNRLHSEQTAQECDATAAQSKD